MIPSHEITYTPPSNCKDSELIKLRRIAASKSISNYALMCKEELEIAIAQANKINGGV